MSAPSDIPPVADDEVLYRRILSRWYDPATSQIAYDAVRPTTQDTTGLSFDRDGDYCTIEDAARGSNPKGYYVALYSAAAIRQKGMTVEARPQPANPQTGEPAKPAHIE